MGREAIAPGTVLLGKYRVEHVLGRGGMGVVVQARHETLDEVVAIKLLTEVGISDVTFTRFMREARAAAKLRSKHVVRVSDVGELDDGLPYMVMELLEGRDLNQLIQFEGVVQPGLLAGLIIQVCEALTEAHSLGIVHRDVKPSNLFVTTVDDLPHVKVLDFGIAKSPESEDFSLTRTSSLLGTPGYMSPEQLRSSRTVDHRTDIWSLGVVMYEALEGRRPFDAESFSELCLKIGIDAVPAMTRTEPALEAIVMRCLEKDPDQRYQAIAEVAVALAPWAAHPADAKRSLDRMQRMARSSEPVLPVATPPFATSSPTLPTLAGESTAPRPQRRTWLIALTAILLVGAGLAVAFVTHEPAADQIIVDKPIASPPPPVAPPPAPPREPPAEPPPLPPRAVAVPEPVAKPIAVPKPRKPTKPPQGKGSAASVPPPVPAGSGSSAPCDPYTARIGC